MTVIENPRGKTPRKLYFAEKNGEPTRYNLMREAIDKALAMSTNEKAFVYVMKRMGYVIDLNPYHKYATIRSQNSKEATRLYHLGDEYDRENIYARMKDTRQNNPYEAYRLYDEFTRKKDFGATIHKAYSLKGNLKTAKKITGLRALYFKYLYMLGVFPKNKKHRPSHAQSIRLKKLSQEGVLDSNAIYEIISEEKPNQQEPIKFKREDFKKYFPPSYTDEQIKKDIVKGLELIKR